MLKSTQTEDVERYSAGEVRQRVITLSARLRSPALYATPKRPYRKEKNREMRQAESHRKKQKLAGIERGSRKRHHLV